MRFTYRDYRARCLKRGAVALNVRDFERMRQSSWLLQQRLERLETDAKKLIRGKSGKALQKLCCDVLALIASVAFLLEDDLTVHPFELHKAQMRAIRVLRRWSPIMDRAGDTEDFTEVFREIEARHRAERLEAQADRQARQREAAAARQPKARTREAERGDLLAAQEAAWSKVVATLSRDELRLLIRMAGKQRTP